ncbi:MAG: DUF5683 domain-containing protein [Cyclobacteriaceae bacterium]
MKKRIVLTSVAISLAVVLFAQDSQRDTALITDSTFIETEQDSELFQQVSQLDPQRAALLSAILPGMGQVYNKQYWKVPIIYGGIAAFAHFIDYNNKLYHALRNAAIAQAGGEDNPFQRIASSQTTLVRNRDVFRRNRDFLIIIGSVFYILNIVDAHVSAHLDEFNVNENLAISIEPSVQSTFASTQAVGASLVIRF